jgi:hypothetical protein
VGRYHECCVEGCSEVEEATVRGGVWRVSGDGHSVEGCCGLRR